jgi:hypothetical protein
MMGGTALRVQRGLLDSIELVDYAAREPLELPAPAATRSPGDGSTTMVSR